MSGLRKARILKVIFAAMGAIGTAAMVVYVHDLKSVSTRQLPSAPVRTKSQKVDEVDGSDSSFTEPLSLGSVFGRNNSAPPPVSISVGHSHDEAEAPDLSTPAATVYSVLSLLDGAATGKLAPCFLEETDDPVSNLYPRYLGHPVGLVDVIEDAEFATVTWEATVHTAFSLNGWSRSPGETIALTARLVQVDGLWKLSQLHDGGENGSQ